MSAFGGEADIMAAWRLSPLLARPGHSQPCFGPDVNIVRANYIKLMQLFVKLMKWLISMINHNVVKGLHWPGAKNTARC